MISISLAKYKNQPLTNDQKSVGLFIILTIVHLDSLNRRRPFYTHRLVPFSLVSFDSLLLIFCIVLRLRMLLNGLLELPDHFRLVAECSHEQTF